MDKPVYLKIEKSDLTNMHQRQAATQTVAGVLIGMGYSKSLWLFLADVVQSFAWMNKSVDKRSAKYRAYSKAREDLLKAAQVFDNARRELNEVTV